MTKKPTCEELEQRVKEVEKEAVARKRAEEALKESEEFSSSLLDNSHNPILVINSDTSVRYVNPALEKITRFSSSELIGTNRQWILRNRTCEKSPKTGCRGLCEEAVLVREDWAGYQS